MAVQCVAQHAALRSTAQHTCALQYNNTTGTTHIPSIVPAAIGGQLGQLGTTCIVWLETALLGLNNHYDSFKVSLDFIYTVSSFYICIYGLDICIYRDS